MASLSSICRLSARRAWSAPDGLGRFDMLRSGGSDAEHRALEHEAEEDRDGDRGEDQPQAQVALLLLRCHGQPSEIQPITLVAAAFSFGGVSKVWNGAGDGTSHSSPSAPSQGRCGATAPLPRIIGSTTAKKKYTCVMPKPNAPIVATMLKSVNCIG